MKRFLIVAVLSGASIVGFATAAQAATCNVTLGAVPAYASGSVSISWTVSNVSHCSGAKVEIVKPASQGGATVLLGTFTNPTTSTTWSTANGSFGDAAGYTVRVTPIASTGNNPGNPKTATTTVDNTAPSIALVSRTGANANSWNNGDVTVIWSCADANPVAPSVSQTVSAEGFALSATGTCADLAGHTSSATENGINIDKTAPEIVLLTRTPANDAGWNNTPVALSWSCSDALSGAASAGDSALLSAEGADQVATGTCTDIAGNVSTDTQEPINVDVTAPSVGLTDRTAANDAGWNNTPVALSWSCSDALSGTSGDLAATVSSEGEAQSAGAICTDLAGNSASDLQSGINIDLSAPSIELTERTAANDAGWNNTPVALSWSCSDALSGAASAGDSALLSAEGADQVATGTCTDIAGNVSTDTQEPINIDLAAPVIALESLTEPNAAGWNNTAVTAAWSCSDALSGATAAGETVVLAADGEDQSASATCTDVAGNSSGDEVTGIDIDTTAPTFGAIERTAPNSDGWNNEDVTVTWGCLDELSGVVDASLSQTLNTEGASQSASATCVDLAGNSASNTATDINIDKTVPLATINQVSALDSVVLPGGTITGSAIDLLSGIDVVEVTFTDLLGESSTRNATLEGTTWSVSTAGLLPGVYTVVARATDVADNESSSAPGTVIHIV